MPKIFAPLARAAAAVACALLASALAPMPANADDVLTVFHGSFPPPMDSVADVVADKMGFFKEQHLTINAQYANNASVCLAEVALGKGDVCAGFVEPIILGYSKGMRLELFLNHNPRYQYRLAVLSDSPIKHLADFKGANIGEISQGGMGEIPTDQTLAGAGLHKTDYSYAPIGLGPQALTAITTKKVDAVVLPQQEIDKMEAVAHLTFRQFPNPRLEGVPNMVFATSPAVIATKADLLRRFSRAMVEAYVFVRVNPEASARLYIEGIGQKVTPDLLANITSVIDAMKPESPALDLADKRIGYVSARGVALYCQFFEDAGRTSDLVPGASFVTDQFIGYANDFDRKALIEKAKAVR
jgi:NitT/TauT family transport system substrate-binding protein